MPDILATLDMTLTGRQEAFALHYATHRSVSRAYRHAYEKPDADSRTADRDGRRVLNATGVRERIEDLINEAASTVVFTIGEALARWLAIASADPNELVALKVGACRYCHGDDHAYHWRMREYLERCDQAELNSAPLPAVGGGFDYDATAEPHANCPECHGEGVYRVVPKDTEELSPQGRLLYGGVKMTAHGPQILIADREKALENACRIIGAFKDDAGAKINVDMRKMINTVNLETTDPQAAARAYLEMIQGQHARAAHG